MNKDGLFIPGFVYDEYKIRIRMKNTLQGYM